MQSLQQWHWTAAVKVKYLLHFGLLHIFNVDSVMFMVWLNWLPYNCSNCDSLWESISQYQTYIIVHAIKPLLQVMTLENSSYTAQPYTFTPVKIMIP